MPADVPPLPWDDAALADALARCAQGDAVAFEAVFDALAPVVWRQLRATGTDADRAEALLEAVLWRVWREAARCPAGRHGAWLHGLVEASMADADDRRRVPAPRRAAGA